MTDYAKFVSKKLSTVPPTGIGDGFSLPGSLFPHQSALTAWALRRGRAAIFADTGLGKSRMQLSWAAAVQRYTKRPVLILAPLAVAAQTVLEGAVLGVEVQINILKLLESDYLFKIGLKKMGCTETLCEKG